MASLRHIISILVIMIWSQASANILDHLPQESHTLEGYHIDSVKTRMLQVPLHNIEGVWQFLDNATTIAIERVNDNASSQYLHQYIYRIVILKPQQLSIEPGTIMGYISATAKKDNYEAYIYTDSTLEGILSIPKKFTLTLSDNHLAFNEYKTSVSINLWRWIPYIYRVGVSVTNTRPKGLDGCVRIYPQSTSAPLTPRYL
ncbi:MAG: hypothetical protein IKV83_07940 [Muribaculaceae bacterium]|nr:hypothetical protein [Muribaculaceae bacterium]